MRTLGTRIACVPLASQSFAACVTTAKWSIGAPIFRAILRSCKRSISEWSASAMCGSAIVGWPSESSRYVVGYRRCSRCRRHRGEGARRRPRRCRREGMHRVLLCGAERRVDVRVQVGNAGAQTAGVLTPRCRRRPADRSVAGDLIDAELDVRRIVRHLGEQSDRHDLDRLFVASFGNQQPVHVLIGAQLRRRRNGLEVIHRRDRRNRDARLGQIAGEVGRDLHRVRIGRVRRLLVRDEDQRGRSRGDCRHRARGLRLCGRYRKSHQHQNAGGERGHPSCHRGPFPGRAKLLLPYAPSPRYSPANMSSIG